MPHIFLPLFFYFFYFRKLWAYKFLRVPYYVLLYLPEANFILALPQIKGLL